jgi:hypothetical protein
VIVGQFGFDQLPNKATDILNASDRVDFSDTFYQASGKGRVRVKNTLLLYADLISLSDISGTDRDLYPELLQRYPKKTTH